MSSGSDVTHSLKVVGTLDGLAPKVRAALEAALAECQGGDIDAMVYETFRSNDLQELYWHRGRDVVPPSHPVTNAKDNLSSWHGYWMAADIISRRYRWFVPPKGSDPSTIQVFKDMSELFFRRMGKIMMAHGMMWGGLWRHADPPHVQWASLPASPTTEDKNLMTRSGAEAVWRKYHCN